MRQTPKSLLARARAKLKEYRYTRQWTGCLTVEETQALVSDGWILSPLCVDMLDYRQRRIANGQPDTPTYTYFNRHGKTGARRHKIES